MLILVGSAYSDFEFPKVHTGISLDGKAYFGKNSNKENYDFTNRFQVRKATLSLNGVLEKNFSYEAEFGVSTCVGSTDQMKLIEAEITYNFSDEHSISFRKGHMMQSFVSVTGCDKRMSPEKPTFVKSFSTCHPFGVAINSEFMITDDFMIETEVSLANGPSETLNDENEINLGVLARTPIDGLSLIGSYNLTRKSYYDENYEQYNRTGYRAIGGLNYENFNFWFTGEYFMGEGFTTDKHEMNAVYTQLGYNFKFKNSFIESILPFVKYEIWDKDIDSDTDQKFENIQGGLNISVSSKTMLRFVYTKEINRGVGAVKTPEELMARVQFNF